jgi:hypothetical protein
MAKGITDVPKKSADRVLGYSHRFQKEKEIEKGIGLPQSKTYGKHELRDAAQYPQDNADESKEQAILRYMPLLRVRVIVPNQVYYESNDEAERQQIQ